MVAELRDIDGYRHSLAEQNLIIFTKRLFPVYQPADHHWRIATALQGIADGTIDRLIVTVPPRHGKALALDTPIPTPTGWATMGALQPGDTVFGSDGVPCSVVAVSDIWLDRPVYRVTTDDGDDFLADAEHEWVVRTCHKRPGVRTIHTTEWLSRDRKRATMVSMHGPLVLADADLPVPPYVLGLWLGDGTTASGAITSGMEDQPFVRAEIDRAGYTTTNRSVSTLFGVSGLQVQLRDIGVLGDKHIPPSYLRSGQGQRLALLQGLIDSDGHVAPDGQIEYCSINRRLAAQVQDLVRSLGVKASLIVGRATINGRDICEKYRVMFYMANAARLPRKLARCRDGVKQVSHYIRATFAGRADTRCIQVDSPDHLFLAGWSMVPTHNSTLTSEHFPAWYLGNHPDKRIIAAAHTSSLAYTFSRRVRSKFSEERWPFDVQVAGDLANVQRWDIGGHRGGYVAVGVGGTPTGFGADCLIIDDAVKSADEADSATYRERNWEWFTQTALTRLEPNGAVVVIGTRWHDDDLIGRILSSPTADRWTVLDLPAISDDGAALWPERFDATALEAIRQEIGTRAFEAQYQGRPSPAEGAILKREWWRYWREPPPAFSRIVQSWDTAYKAKESNDYSVGMTWGVALDGYYLLDRWRERVEFPDLKRAVVSQYLKWDPQEIVVEDAASGQSLIQELKAGTRLPIIPFKVDRDKVARVNAISAVVESGRVFLPAEASWLGEFEEEAAAFPFGAYDDQVDSLSMALARMALGAQEIEIGPNALVDAMARLMAVR